MRTASILILALIAVATVSAVRSEKTDRARLIAEGMHWGLELPLSAKTLEAIDEDKFNMTQLELAARHFFHAYNYTDALEGGVSTFYGLFKQLNSSLRGVDASFDTIIDSGLYAFENFTAFKIINDMLEIKCEGYSPKHYLWTSSISYLNQSAYNQSGLEFGWVLKMIKTQECLPTARTLSGMSMLRKAHRFQRVAAKVDLELARNMTIGLLAGMGLRADDEMLMKLNETHFNFTLLEWSQKMLFHSYNCSKAAEKGFKVFGKFLKQLNATFAGQDSIMDKFLVNALKAFSDYETFKRVDAELSTKCEGGFSPKYALWTASQRYLNQSAYNQSGIEISNAIMMVLSGDCIKAPSTSSVFTKLQTAFSESYLEIARNVTIGMLAGVNRRVEDEVLARIEERHFNLTLYQEAMVHLYHSYNCSKAAEAGFAMMSRFFVQFNASFAGQHEATDFLLSNAVLAFSNYTYYKTIERALALECPIAQKQLLHSAAVVFLNQSAFNLSGIYVANAALMTNTRACLPETPAFKLSASAGVPAENVANMTIGLLASFEFQVDDERVFAKLNETHFNYTLLEQAQRYLFNSYNCSKAASKGFEMMGLFFQQLNATFRAQDRFIDLALDLATLAFKNYSRFEAADAKLSKECLGGYSPKFALWTNSQRFLNQSAFNQSGIEIGHAIFMTLSDKCIEDENMKPTPVAGFVATKIAKKESIAAPKMEENKIVSFASKHFGSRYASQFITKPIVE